MTETKSDTWVDVPMSERDAKGLLLLLRDLLEVYEDDGRAYLLEYAIGQLEKATDE